MSDGVVRTHFQNMTQLLDSVRQLTSTIRSSKSKGDDRELFIREFLETHLPSRLRIGHGEIVDSSGRVSGEVDAVIYRDDIPRLHMGGTDVFLCEGVLAAMEIKSDLTKEELERSLENLERIKALEKRIKPLMYLGKPRSDIIAYLFAFDGMGREAILRHMQDWYSRRPAGSTKPIFDVVCVLRKCVIIRNDGVVFKKESEQDVLSMDLTQDNLFVLFVHMLHSQAAFQIVNYDYSGYISSFKLQ